MCEAVIFDFNRTVYNPLTGKLMEGAQELLNKLEADGVRMSLLSKTFHDGRREEIEALGIANYFDAILVTFDDKQKAHFDKLLAAMNTAPSKTVVIGDRVKSEIALGNRIGMRTIWFRNGKFRDELPEAPSERPNKIISDLFMILKYPEMFLDC